MLSQINRRYTLKVRPATLPGPEHFQVEEVPHPALQPGEVRVKALYHALSPWQGQRLKDFKNYTKPFEMGELIDGDVLGEVIETTDDAVLLKGDLVTARLGWQDYAVVRGDALAVVSDEFDPTLWLTALSSPGLTAYTALDLFGRCMPGQSMVVTSAAGSVGSYAVQLGKLAGMRVIGVAGGPEKCRHVVRTLGANACLDHKSPEYAAKLAEALPDGAHQVFDTTGGPIADAVFDNIAKYARVLIVGRTASNTSDRPDLDPVNMRLLWGREATVHGFSRYSYPERWAFARERMAALCREGRLIASHNTVEGFEQLPSALHDMLAGEFIGKVLVKAAEPST
ncbi:MAG: NADP-dependent oxidoreductase [Pseudomonadota bacterium]